MTEAQAKDHLKDMLASFRPGSVLHILAQVVREAEAAHAGGLDEIAQERVLNAEAFHFVAGCGLMSALPR